jgi:hypothetical protein
MLWIVKGWSGSDFVFFYSNISPLGQWSGITGEAQRNPSLKPSGLSFLFESGKAGERQLSCPVDDNYLGRFVT